MSVRQPAETRLRLILAVALLLCVASNYALLAWASARSGAAPQKAAVTGTASNKRTFDELYAQGQLANKDIKTLTARFIETTSNSLLREDRPIVTRGMLYVERPSRVAMQYTEPADRRIVIDGKWMTSMMHGVSQRLDVGAAQEKAQKNFIGSDAGGLRRIFDIDLRDSSARPGTREVVMLPKPKQIKESLLKLELWVGERNGLLDAMRMTFANGDTKLMEFENVTPNAAIDPSVFVVPK